MTKIIVSVYTELAIFGCPGLQQEGDKMAITWSSSVISLKFNGDRLAITCNLFVTIWQLTVIHW